MVAAIRINTHDLAEMQRLVDRLALYRRGSIAINGLIADVETILGGLETDDMDLRRRLREQWGVLEQIYAYGMAMRAGEFDDESKQEIREAVDELESIVKGVIAANE